MTNPKRPAPDTSRISSLLGYEPQRGQLIWLTNRRGQPRPGNVAGTLRSDGYSQVRVDGGFYMAHHLAWFLYHGVWPEGEIDHRDLNKLNNSISNLRIATHSQNMANVASKKRVNGGHLKGAHFMRRSNKWASHITINRKTIYLGMFRTEKEAHAAYAKAATECYREFARLA